MAQPINIPESYPTSTDPVCCPMSIVPGLNSTPTNSASYPTATVPGLISTATSAPVGYPTAMVPGFNPPSAAPTFNPASIAPGLLGLAALGTTILLALKHRIKFKSKVKQKSCIFTRYL